LGDGHLLEELADWIETYLQTTEAHSIQWWDLVEGEREFWDELPSLVEALMHRRYIFRQAAYLPRLLNSVTQLQQEWTPHDDILRFG
jgi:hypothetical protein